MGNKRILLKGQQFGDWTVLEDLPGGKCLCRCSCDKHTERVVLSRSLRTGKSTSCGHKDIKDLSKEPIGTFGDWVPLQYVGSGEWRCRCSCGIEKNVKAAHLISGASKSCGHNTTGFKDMTGKQFGYWKVLKYLGNRTYLCRCTACNKVEKEVNAYALQSGASTNCGCVNLSDLTGKTFGELTVLYRVEGSSWMCECSCDNKTKLIVTNGNLQSGHVKSCGCKSTEYKAETMLERYGETTASRIDNPRSIEAIESGMSREGMLKAINKCENIYGDAPTVLELSDQLEITRPHVLKKIHKFELEDYVKIGVFGQLEESIAKMLLSWGVEIERHNKNILNGFELDIYIPSNKLAIEFNGSYWHSDKLKDKYYHQKKTIECAKKGIRLIHIFEYEWLNEDTQVKIVNMLKRILLPSENTVVYARQTVLNRIGSSEVEEFVDNNHLQNNVNTAINYGLTFNNELVAVMTFGKPRFTKDDTEFELIRLAYKSGIIVVGGSNKLFKAFINEYDPKSIVSYCDISKFTGNVYLDMGFKPDNDPFTTPNYVWVSKDQKTVLKRYQTMKHRLIKRGLGNPGMTEKEIMESLGYSRVYDCGNLKFTWNNGE